MELEPHLREALGCLALLAHEVRRDHLVRVRVRVRVRARVS